jgi:Flp pilus assembly protein TadG
MLCFTGMQRAIRSEQGSSLVEFAISLPLLVVFIVGIYDFSGAFNQKQKIEQAAHVGVIIAASSPMADIDGANPNPASLQPVVAVVFNSLADSNVLPSANLGSCKAGSATPSGPAGLTWTYTITGCPDTLTIQIDRGWVPAGPPTTVGTRVTVSYPYQWQFNSVIQLLIPGSTYSANTLLSETASVHNQN